PQARHREEEGNGRSHRRSRAHVSARDGRRRTAQPRGRNRHCQAHRGRSRHDDPGPVRKPDHLQRDHRMVDRAQQWRDAAARDSRSRRDAVQGTAARKPLRGRRGSRRRNQRSHGRPLVQGRGRSRGRRTGRRRRGRRTARTPRASGGGRGRGQHPQPRPDG
ncbi:hypothetical protein OY671_011508, partial [Metschnikowia pulcherrima]